MSNDYRVSKDAGSDQEQGSSSLVDIYKVLLGEVPGSNVQGEVDYHTNLPSAGSVSGQVYRVLKRTANYWTLGITSRWVAGFYESDGTTWTLLSNAATPLFNVGVDDANTTNYRMFTPSDVASLGGSSDQILSVDGDLLKITDVSLIYDDGSENRIHISSSSNKFLTADGYSYTEHTNSQYSVLSGNIGSQYLRLDINASNSSIHSPTNVWSYVVHDSGFEVKKGSNVLIDVSDTNTTLKSPDMVHSIVINDSNIKLIRSGINRLLINNTKSQLVSSDSGSYLEARAGSVRINQGGSQRLWMDSGETEIRSPDTLNFLYISNVILSQKYAGVDRVYSDATYSALVSPDTLQSLSVDDTGAFYNTAEIMTVDNIGVDVASLVGGLIPEAELPSYIDDVIEGYLDIGDTKSNGYEAFYVEVGLTTIITAESGKIFVDLNDSKAYRWTGTTHVVIGSGLALGETSATAYRGDRGKTAYDHSQSAHDYAATSHVHNKIESADSLLSSTFTNTDHKILIAGVTRLLMDSTDIQLISPDTTQELTVTDSGAFYNGVEISTTDSLGTGNVVGPSSSVDFRVPTFNGASGTLLRQSPVSISSIGVIIGVTSFSVDDLLMNGNTLEATGTNKTLIIKGSGTGGLLINDTIGITDTGFITDVNRLDVDNIRIDGNVLSTTNTDGDLNLIPDGNGEVIISGGLSLESSSEGYVIQAKTSSSTIVALRIKEYAANVSAIVDFHSSSGTRKTWLGFGSSGDRKMFSLVNDDTGGGIQILAGSSANFAVHLGATTTPERLYASTTASGMLSPDGNRYAFVSNNECAVALAWAVGSDERLKDEIVDLDNKSIEFINNLRPVSYKLKTNSEIVHLGLIAQDVQSVQISDIVSEGDNGMLGVKYTEIIAPMVKYMQELSVKLDAALERIEELENN